MPKTFKSFSLRPEADEDLRDIWLYGFERWSKEIADAYYRRIFLGIEDLLRGLKAVQDVSLAYPDFYRIKVGAHHIYFLEDEDNIDVVRILHERQNPSLHL